MLARWFKRRARVERVEPLLIGASGARTAPALATSDGVTGAGEAASEPTPVLVPVDSEPARMHAPGAPSAPEGTSIAAPELSRMHARLLLGWVADSDWSHRDARADVVAVEDGKPVLLASALLEIYREMCAEKGIVERPWNPVARELRALTGDRKGYAWIERDGAKHRLRVYRIDVGAGAFARRIHAPGAVSAPEGATNKARAA